MSLHNFIELNRKKLVTAFITTSIIFTVMMLSIYAYTYYKGNIIDIIQLIVVLVVFGIILPLFIIWLTYLEWFAKRSRRTKAYNAIPFKDLDKLGFERSYKNIETKWIYTEEIKKGKINGFTIYCDFDEKNFKILEFTPAVWREKFNSENEFNEVLENFKKHEIEWFEYGPTKKYNLKKLTINSIEDLKKELEDFTRVLLNVGFVPLEVNEYVSKD